jgi:hypothetical protein
MPLFKKSIKKEIKELLILLDSTDFRKEDKKNAEEYLMYNEWGLSLDTIVSQLYEFDIKISTELFNKIKGIAERMKIPESDFSFLKKLIK